MVEQGRIAGPAGVAGWSRALGALHERVGRRFARSEARERVKRYLLGLLGRVERKNGWQMAEAIGERDPQGVQRLLNSAKWDADAVRDDLREYVLKHLGDEGTGVLIVDETGFLKKGEKSAGVARQYTGTAGSTNKVGTAVAYNAASQKAVLDLNNNLAAGTKYKVVVTTGAKDLAGNALDQDLMTAGDQQKTWTFTTKG